MTNNIKKQNWNYEKKILQRLKKLSKILLKAENLPTKICSSKCKQLTKEQKLARCFILISRQMPLLPSIKVVTPSYQIRYSI